MLIVDVLPLPQETIRQHAMCNNDTIWGQFSKIRWDQYDVLMGHVKAHALFLMSIEVHSDHVNYITRSSTSSERLYRNTSPWTLPVVETKSHDRFSLFPPGPHERTFTTPDIVAPQVQDYQAGMSKGIQVPEDSIATSMVGNKQQSNEPAQPSLEHSGLQNGIQALHERIASIASHMGAGREDTEKESLSVPLDQPAPFTTRQAPLFGVPGDLKQNSPVGPLKHKSYPSSLFAISNMNRATAPQNLVDGTFNAERATDPFSIKSGDLPNQGMRMSAISGFGGIGGNRTPNPAARPTFGSSGLGNTLALNHSSNTSLLPDLRPATTGLPTSGGSFTNFSNVASFPRACNGVSSECKIESPLFSNKDHVSEPHHQAPTRGPTQATERLSNQCKTEIPTQATQGRTHSWLVEPDIPQPSSAGLLTEETQRRPLPLSADYLRALQEAYLPSTQANKSTFDQGPFDCTVHKELCEVGFAKHRPFSDPFATTVSPFSNLKPATNNGTGSVLATNQSLKPLVVEGPRSLFDGLGAPSAPLTSREDATSAAELDRVSESIARGKELRLMDRSRQT